MEEILWAYLPILIALGVIIISLRVTILNRKAFNLICSILVLLTSVFGIYLLGSMILKPSYPSYTPHLAIGLSSIIGVIQFIVGKEKSTWPNKT